MSATTAGKADVVSPAPEREPLSAVPKPANDDVPRNPVDFALAYARRGLPVFPLIPGTKKPACEWKDEATTNPRKIRAWWKRRPNANVGVSAGEGGYTVIDLDVKGGKNGIAEFEKLTEGRASELSTFTVRTASGGKHLYFSGITCGSGTDKLGTGCDVKSEGGYVVGAGSIVDGKRYEIVGDTTFAAAPNWLRDILHKAAPPGKQRKPRRQVEASVALDTPAAIEQAKRYLKEEEPAVDGDGGDAHTYRVASRVLDFGVSLPVALHLMLAHWDDRNEPPWGPKELAVKIDNAARYRLEPLGIASPEAAFEGLDLEQIQDPVLTDLLPINSVSLADWADKDPPPQEYVLEGVFPAGKLSLLAGDGGVGKTYLMQWLMTRIATGSQFAGRNVLPGIAYGKFDEDDQSDLIRRQKAINGQASIDMRDLDGRCYPVSYLETDPLLWNKEPTKLALKIIKTIEDAKALADAGRGPYPRLWIIDNITTAFAGDILNPQEISGFMKFLRQQAARLGVAIVVTAHITKGGADDLDKNDLDALKRSIYGGVYWVNGSRSVVYVAREADDTKGYAVVVKGNQGERGQRFYFEQDQGAGMIVPTASDTSQDGLNDKEREVLDLIAQREAQAKRDPLVKLYGNSAHAYALYPPLILTKRAKPRASDRQRKALRQAYEAAMLSLERKGEIVRDTRKGREVWVTWDAHLNLEQEEIAA